MRQDTIDSLIFDRLAAHGSVFLPDVGSLRCERIAAAPAFDGNGFTAPRYIVEYISVPCGISVIDLLAANRQIPEEEAAGLYRSWLEQALLPDGNPCYAIAQVGTLELYEGGTALFTTDAALLPYLNPYGTMTQETVSEPEPETVPAEEIPGTGSELPAHRPVPPPLPPQFRKRKPAGPNASFWKTMTLALVFLLAFAVGIIVFGPSFLLRTGEKPASGPVSADTVVIRDLRAVQPERNDDPSRPAADLPRTDPAKPYHIIAGSFRSKEKAEAFMNREKEEFESVKLLYDSDKALYMVSVYQFATHQEARRQINRMPILYYPYSYWIYHEPVAEP